MRPLVLAGLLLLVLLPGMAAASPPPAGGCEFELGFAAFRAAIPEVVGECLGPERHDDLGNARQETTAWHGKDGLLYWRKADNWTGFTDGHRTWVAGREGVVSRLNTDRFAWEPDRLVATLRDADYRLPFGFDPRRADRETTFRLTGGVYENREQRVRVQLVESVKASGDLDGDGTPDAVALLVVNSGGSGVFEYAVAMLDRGGRPVQAGYEFLGDRVKVNRLTIADRQITVDMVTQGPGEPMCCPTQRVDRRVDIRVPDAASP